MNALIEEEEGWKDGRERRSNARIIIGPQPLGSLFSVTFATKRTRITKIIVLTKVRS